MKKTDLLLLTALVVAGTTPAAAGPVSGVMGVESSTGTEINPATQELQEAISASLLDMISSTSAVQIVGHQSINKVKVDGSGRLFVSQQPPGAPNGTTRIEITAFDAVSGEDENQLTLTAGTTYFITHFIGGSESSNSGAVTKLVLTPQMGSEETVAVGFTNGSNFDFDIQFSTVAASGSKIKMVRENLGGGSIEIFGRWEGYYE